MKKGFVISDLHLFAERSVGGRYLAPMKEAAAEADYFVLNGDIFDFRWSTLSGPEESVRVAVEWLRELAVAHPRCRFYYILGNHDSFEPFARGLDRLAAEVPNFAWHPTHLRLGESLFLHGDLHLEKAGAGPSPRTLHPKVGRNGRTLRLGYRIFIATGAHRLIALLHRPRRSADRIRCALEANGSGRWEGVTDIYFGHTHLPFSDFRHGNLTFHNTGSAIRGLKCNMLAVKS